MHTQCINNIYYNIIALYLLIKLLNDFLDTSKLYLLVFYITRSLMKSYKIKA